MTVTLPAPYLLCDLTVADHTELIALWERAGLHIRPEGRDAPDALARQMASGQQRVIGIRAVTPDVPQGAPGGTAAGPLVAVAVLTHDGRKGWVNRLAVDPSHRRRKLAAALVDEAERWFTEDVGLEVWAALIESDNTASRSLFRALGFQQLDIVYVTKRTRPEA
jgi:GNAT superfamily N-acetyltransferase